MAEPLPEARRGYPSYPVQGHGPDRPRKPRYALSRGYRIAYDDVGDGPPVVLVHGVTLSGGDWWDSGAVSLLLAGGYRVLVVDPLAHGQSARPHDPAAYPLPEIALDVIAPLDAAGIERAAFWGYSRGATLVTVCAIEAPDRVERLIVGGAGGMEAPPSREPAEWHLRLLGGDWQAYWETPPGAGYTPDERAYAERALDPRALAAAWIGRRRSGYELRLAGVRCPTLLYGGSDDDLNDSIATAVLLGTTARVLPGLDHGTAIVEAGLVWDIVEPFLRGGRSSVS